MTGVGGLGTIEVFVILVAIAGAVGLVTIRLSMPYSIALVLAGLVVATWIPADAVVVTPDLILAVLIPGLVFEAAYKLDVDELRKTFGITLILAVPGVVVTAAVVAFVVWSVTGLDPTLGFLLGAIVSATDPVAVIELFKRIRAPSRLATAVDAEALLNDGTGVVLFTIALVAVSRPVGVVEGAVSMLAVVALSTVIGLLAGAAAARLMSLTHDQMVQTTITVVAAYGTYLAALRLDQSGIIATVVAGVVIGFTTRRRMTSTRIEALDSVWGFAAFGITAFTFLLIGIAIEPGLLVSAIPVIVSGYIAITLARAFVVYVVIGGSERARPGPSLLRPGELHVMFWSGLRGAIAIALTLALPTDLPQRDLITGAAYGIVLVTLLVQGTTAGWLVRRVGAAWTPEDLDSGINSVAAPIAGDRRHAG